MPTFDERFEILRASKPLPLIPQPAARNPGPIQTTIGDMIYHDKMRMMHQRRFDAAQSDIDRLTGGSDATPTNP